MSMVYSFCLMDLGTFLAAVMLLLQPRGDRGGSSPKEKVLGPEKTKNLIEKGSHGQERGK